MTRSYSYPAARRWAALGGVLIAMVTFTGVVQAEVYAKGYAITQRANVHVDTNDGSVRVVTSDAKQVEFHVEYSGLVFDQAPRIESHQQGDRVDLTVRVVGASRWFASLGVTRTPHIEVRMPKEADLQVETGDGSVQASLLVGNISLHTGDGSIKADGLSGNLDLRSGDGSITVNSLKGTASLTTGDGSISGTDLDGRYHATTGDGSIHLAGRFDGLLVKTGDGSIDTRALPGSTMSAGWNLRTGSGSIEMALPPDLPADFDATTGDGRISLDIPVDGAVTKSEVRGRINGGGQPLTLHTGDGSIHLNRV
jgi:hypothetical protein